MCELVFIFLRKQNRLCIGECLSIQGSLLRKKKDAFLYIDLCNCVLSTGKQKKIKWREKTAWKDLTGKYRNKTEVLVVLEILGIKHIKCVELYPRSKVKSFVDFKNDRIWILRIDHWNFWLSLRLWIKSYQKECLIDWNHKSCACQSCKHQRKWWTCAESTGTHLSEMRCTWCFPVFLILPKWLLVT